MADYPYNGPWPQLRLQVLQRDGYRCRIRGPRCIGDATHADHIIPWQEGGPPWEPTNLRAACEPCNTGRGAARMHAMAKLNRQPATAPSREW